MCVADRLVVEGEEGEEEEEEEGEEEKECQVVEACRCRPNCVEEVEVVVQRTWVWWSQESLLAQGEVGESLAPWQVVDEQVRDGALLEE